MNLLTKKKLEEPGANKKRYGRCDSDVLEMEGKVERIDDGERSEEDERPKPWKKERQVSV